MFSYKIKYLIWLYLIRKKFPNIIIKSKIGKYPLKVKVGKVGISDFGELLEYRVWEHNNKGNDVCHFFDDLKNATWYSLSSGLLEQPIALVEEKDNNFSEWAIEWLPDKK